MNSSIWKYILIGFFVLIVYPVKALCGTWAIGYACAMPPTNPKKYYACYYYELEPLSVALLERKTGKNISIYYFSGHTCLRRKNIKN